MAATEIKNVIGIDPRLDIHARKNRINIVPQGASNISYQKTIIFPFLSFNFRMLMVFNVY